MLAVGVVAAATFLGLANPAHAAGTFSGDSPVKAPARVATRLDPPPSVGSTDKISTPTGKVARKEPPLQPGQITTAATYFYASSYQFAVADGLFANATVAQPALGTDSHTLFELAAQSADGQQIVEVGWTVDRGLNGDLNPRLFVFHWVDRIPSCYNGCGFVQYSATIRPGAWLGNGTHSFTIQHYQGNWWIRLNSEWIGYYPDTLWGGRYTRTGLHQWFGEVAANSGSPCADMGNGLFASSLSAASVSGMSNINGPAVSKSSTVTNASFYSLVSTGSNSMRFGGPGAC
jgi:hypothetical protein